MLLKFVVLTMCSTLATGQAIAAEDATDRTQPVTVRVRDTPGGPQIHVDGKPVPPRFFLGWYVFNRRIAVDESWGEHAFEFTPDIDVPGNGTLHLRFDKAPGEIWFSDLRVTDVATGADVLPPGSLATEDAFRRRWTSFPPTTGPTTAATLSLADGALHVAPVAPEAGAPWPDFHLYSHVNLSFEKGRTYRCVFRAKATRGQAVHPAVYLCADSTWTRIDAGDGPFLSQVALARNAGVDLISFGASITWTPPGQEPNWTPLDTICRRIIDVNPNALLLPRLSAEAPRWWLERYPEARMVYDQEVDDAKACVSNRTYRADVSAHFERVARHLCETFPKNFAGLHPCGQKTGEWFYERPDLLNGYDPATRAAFRRWLKERGDPEADAADVPTPAERRDRADGLLLDPVRSRRIVEFNRFQQEEMADTILAIARACRRGSDGKKLVVLFYGYGFELSNHRNGAASSGHLALGKVLREGNDVIDVLCGPNSYTDRSWLGTGPVMSAAETISRAGILWLNEDDTRTHLFHRNPRPRNAHGVVADLNQTRQVLLRNTAQAALRGFGTWWMDLFGDGWYDDEVVWREMVRLRPLDEAMLQRKSPFAPEIAAILDEDGMCHLADGARVASTPLIYHGRAALGRCGAPYGQYLLNDVLDDETPARMQVFLSAWRLTADQRKALAAQRDGKPAQQKARQTGNAQPVVPARVWCWAPGYLYPDRADVEGIEEVTGFAASAVSPATAEVAPTELGLAMGLAEAWGPAAPIQPLFSVVAAPDEVLATYSDGSPAVAMRRSEAGIDVFVGTPQLTPELIHAIAKASGVHLFTQPGPTLWAAEGYLSVQSHASGPLMLDTGCMQPVVDALDGALLGNGPLVELNMEQGEVRILQIRR